MGHIDVSAVEYSLSDGRVLLNDVSFRVGDGAKVALIGPNGSGKTTLVRMICGDISPDEGSVAITGGLGVMRQFIGSVRDETTVREILISVAPARIRDAAAKIIATGCESSSRTLVTVTIYALPEFSNNYHWKSVKQPIDRFY